MTDTPQDSPPPGELLRPSPIEPASLPPYVTPQTPRSRGRLVAAAVGVVAVVAAAAFAVTALAGGGDGAATPEEAVEALLDAVAAEDIIGVLEALPPGERGALRGGVEDLTGELERLGILSDDFALDGVQGFDVEFEGVELESNSIGDGVSVVEVVAGTVTGTTDPADFPLGETLTSLLEQEGEDLEGEGGTETDELAGTQVVTIREADGWHVSLFYSVAEIVRQGVGAPVPDFGNGVVPDGADSPEGAVRALLERAANLDLRGVIALLPPDEMRVLHDYAPLFLDDVDEELDDVREDYEVTVDGIEADVEGSGDTRRVALRAFSASGSTPDGDFDVSYDGECFEGTFDGERETICPSDFAEEFDVFEDSFTSSVADGGVTVVERDGAWFVSPLRTIFDVVTILLESIDADDLDSIEDLLDGIFAVDITEDFEDLDEVVDPDDPATTTTSPPTTGTTPGTGPGNTTSTTAGGDESSAGSNPPPGCSALPEATGPPVVGPDEIDAPIPPGDLGDDPCLDFLAQGCFAGNMLACDELYFDSPFGSSYEEYAASCAGRVPDNFDDCAVVVGETAPN